MNNTRHRIGFIGQGFIGKNYADDFENRGYEVVRYALEAPYNKNKEQIKDCNIVFVAVPTPTTPAGFDDSFVRDAVSVTAPGTTVVIKSTMALGSTEKTSKFINTAVLREQFADNAKDVARERLHEDPEVHFQALALSIEGVLVSSK